MGVVLPRGEAAGAKGMWGTPWLSDSDLLSGFWGVIPILVFWSVWVAMSSPRGAKIQNSRLMDVIRALLLFECCHARSQLENAHIITFQLVRTAEIWVRDGFGAIRVETAATHA